MQGLLTTASKTDGEYAYNFATIPFIAEVLKAAVSGLLLQRELRSGKRVKMTWSASASALYVTPALIYLLHNNVQFLTLKYLDPATYQVLGNLKIVSTGLLFWLFLGRQLSRLQWTALLLLTMGATTSQVRRRLLPPVPHPAARSLPPVCCRVTGAAARRSRQRAMRPSAWGHP